MNNENVAHNFVYGQNAKGSNFESTNGTLWSYGSKLAIKQNEIIFISDYISHYSNSSSRQFLYLNRAIGWNNYQRDNTITIYGDIEAIAHHLSLYRNKAIKEEIQFAINDIKDYLIKQSKARKKSYFEIIEIRINNINKIIEKFGIDKRSTEYKEFIKYSDIQSLKENYKDIIAVHAKNIEKKKKLDILKRYEKIFKKIQNFTGMNNKEMKNYSKSDIVNYDFLSINGDQLCTSQNLCVDLRESKILYKMLITGRDIIGKKIGYYTIISHNKKSVKIGCHNILINELKRVLNEN